MKPQTYSQKDCVLLSIYLRFSFICKYSK